MLTRRVIMKIIVPSSTLIAGIFIPIAIDRLTKGNINEQQLTLLVLIGFLLAIIVLIIAFSVIFSETHTVHEQLIEIQKEIISKIDKSTLKFGLLVEFIEEIPTISDGATYDASIKLIEKAEKSIVFLDAWAQTKDYHLTEITAEKRKAYYNAILQKIEEKKYAGEKFHKRIIQISDFENEKFELTGGALFKDYLKKCLELQRNTPAVSEIRIAPLVINAQFVIIDEVYVIWPILTYEPESGGITRHAAIFFHDPLKQFVPRLMAIYHKIETKARPFEDHHLGVSNVEDL